MAHASTACMYHLMFRKGVACESPSLAPKLLVCICLLSLKRGWWGMTLSVTAAIQMLMLAFEHLWLLSCPAAPEGQDASSRNSSLRGVPRQKSAPVMYRSSEGGRASSSAASLELPPLHGRTVCGRSSACSWCLADCRGVAFGTDVCAVAACALPACRGLATEQCMQALPSCLVQLRPCKDPPSGQCVQALRSPQKGTVV